MRLYNWSYCNGDTPTTALMTFIELIRRNVELHWHSHSLSVVDFTWLSRVYIDSQRWALTAHTHTLPLISPHVTHDTCLAIFSFNQLLYAFICISYELNWFAYARVWVTEAWWLAVSRQVTNQSTNQPTNYHPYTLSPPQLIWSGLVWLHEMMIWLVDSMVNQQLAFSCEIWCTADSLNPACWYLKANTQPTDDWLNGCC
jgi:hypothetical protein